MAKKKRTRTTRTTPRRRTAPDWAPKFLKSLGLQGSIRKACVTAKIGRTTFYERRDRDEEFAVAVANAIEEAADRLEEVADARAKKKSDALLIFRLKSLRPGKYRDSVQHDHGGRVEHVVFYVPDDTRNPPATETGRSPAQPG